MVFCHNRHLAIFDLMYLKIHKKQNMITRIPLYTGNYLPGKELNDKKNRTQDQSTVFFLCGHT